LELPPSQWERAWGQLRHREVLWALGLCALAAVAICAALGAWDPPLPYRLGQTPSRAVTARVGFLGAKGERYEAGAVLAEVGQPISGAQLRLLKLEHAAVVAGRTFPQRLVRATATVALVLVLTALAALYLYHRHRPRRLPVKELATVLVLSVLTVTVARWAALDPWRAEVVPLLAFAQVVAIVYCQETALVLTTVLTVLVVMGLGQGMGALVLLAGAAAVAVLQLNRIRSRSKLIYVGLATGLTAAALCMVTALAADQQPSWALAGRAGWLAGCALGTGFLLTGLLPFVERYFGILTDVSLLELGDVSHPLLQELVRRAPSTYNHSITVAAIAEAAADAIGARGLLVRVGAYFHDIGKMLKPEYFIENQPLDENRHASLIPAMSTLVIIAHIKDGADLARKHKLPQAIIDFIEQHHGTTLVEYFYGRAHEMRHNDPNGGPVDENSYRYPGPRPQTKEAAVLMLADAAESACRSLIDPAPSRIESLVRDVARRKLTDGQFDETNLTLRELRTIEDSVIKSLVANYHGRVKYPGQRTA
ncbi:MAG TPA: HDIG domain-containing protein, partial [Planctomycetaceae bacterium]|nr:HDIG domain-containing protein [Planctomycetaceae bacterium]